MKKINPEHPSTIRAIPQPERVHLEKGSVRSSQVEGLPRIKIHSEPNEKVGELMSRLREGERRKYDYNRPSWWG